MRSWVKELLKDFLDEPQREQMYLVVRVPGKESDQPAHLRTQITFRPASTHRQIHYENTPIQVYWKFHLQKLSFQIKVLIFFFFHISAQNMDCGYLLEPPRWGGSNEYPQPMFLSRNKKNNVYPCKPQFYYI